MKRVISLFLAVMIIMVFAACSKAESPLNDMPMEEMMASVVGDAAGEIMVETAEIPEDQFSWQLFIEPIDGAEAYKSEALISAIAHSVNLLRVPEGTDAEAVAEDIRANADPRKWICVEAETTLVKVSGRVILFVMSTEEIASQIEANFDALTNQ